MSTKFNFFRQIFYIALFKIKNCYIKNQSRLNREFTSIHPEFLIIYTLKLFLPTY